MEKKTKRIKLTPSQEGWMRSLFDEEDPMRNVHGQAAHGGAARVETSLKRHDLLDKHGEPTDAGYNAVAVGRHKLFPTFSVLWTPFMVKEVATAWMVSKIMLDEDNHPSFPRPYVQHDVVQQDKAFREYYAKRMAVKYSLWVLDKAQYIQESDSWLVMLRQHHFPVLETCLGRAVSYEDRQDVKNVLGWALLALQQAHERATQEVKP